MTNEGSFLNNISGKWQHDADKTSLLCHVRKFVQALFGQSVTSTRPLCPSTVLLIMSDDLNITQWKVQVFGTATACNFLFYWNSCAELVAAWRHLCSIGKPPLPTTDCSIKVYTFISHLQQYCQVSTCDSIIKSHIFSMLVMLEWIVYK